MKELDEIEARANAASKGPWEASYIPDMKEPGYGEWIIDSEKTFIASTQIWNDRGKFDSEFIAEAREDIPKMVAALKGILALPHEDYCCTKGCPGGGLCGHGYMDASQCIGVCSCFLQGPIRVIEEAFGIPAPKHNEGYANFGYLPPTAGGSSW